MPLRTRVVEFTEAVIAGNHAQVIADYYHEDAFMQENLRPRREGRKALIAYENDALSRLKTMDTEAVRKILVDGDDVAIHWSFVATDLNDEKRRLIEVSLQKWRGDRIAEEQFFYDSATAWQTL